MDSETLLEVCRICLEYTNDNSCSIFDDNEDSKDILDKIYLCFQIVLKSDKNMPGNVCINCIKELNAANNFRLKCITIDERFAVLKKNITKETYPKSNHNIDMRLKYAQDDSCDSSLSLLEENGTCVSNESCLSETESNAFKYKCNLCNKLLKTKISLSKHIISMHHKRKTVGKVTGFGPTRRYHCTSCPYSTPHSQTLVNHVRRHDGQKPYQCECGKSFTQSSSLAAHQKTHSNTTYYTCTICGKQFKHAYSLKKHQHVHETGKLTCNVCHKILKTKQSLQDHMYRHYNIRNFNCEECGDTFVTSSELISHKKKHNLHKTLECYLCGYKTHAKKSLIIHIKRHTGDKHFKCDLCDVTFYTQGDVKRHRRVHTREKPFGCPTCAQRFTYSTSLNKHMFTVHGVHYKWGDFKHKEAQKNCTTKIYKNTEII